jgi:HD superfamily phosphohydrolase
MRIGSVRPLLRAMLSRQGMQYVKTVYGSTSFTAPMILELMQSDAMQRVRSVLQHGITAVFGITQSITRFEPSLAQ